MIKKTIIACASSTDAPNLILIPGGPGLSSHSIRGFDLLSKSFNLHYIDFPGANGQPYERDYLFEEISEVLKEYVERLSGNAFVLGHSYGGLLAVDVALKTDVSGIVCVATPFTAHAMDLAVTNYNDLKSDRLNSAESAWGANPTDKTLAAWLSEYGPLYFSKETIDAGRELLAKDPVSSKFFRSNQPDTRRVGGILFTKVGSTKTRRLFIAGSDDRLIPSDQVEIDAKSAGFEFVAVPSASHFVMLDQPESVARLVEELSRQKIKGEL